MELAVFKTTFPFNEAWIEPVALLIGKEEKNLKTKGKKKKKKEKKKRKRKRKRKRSKKKRRKKEKNY